MTEHILHISIGPVQGFVAQARRTRDLWAGSFLLSWISGQLMAATFRQDGQIVFPSVGTKDNPENPMLSAILGKPLSNDSGSEIGSLPNRFKALVPADFDPKTVAGEAREKWKELAERVWEKFVKNAIDEDQKARTRKIWERQIDGFWEIQWVMGVDRSNGSWLDARKNWRSHWPPQEGGDHCTTMGDWQELSGFMRSSQRQHQDAFWNKLRRRTGRLDLRDDERLCAIALVKRLFPKLERDDLQRTINWPSTVYMAVAPWLMHIAQNSALHPKLHDYVKKVREFVGEKTFKQLASEYSTQLPGLAPLGCAANLDGNLYLKTALANPRATPLNDDSKAKSGDGDPDKEIRKKLLQKLGEAVGGDANSFYALLLMDGDRLGKLLQKEGEKRVSKSLAKFVEKVPEIVPKYNGVTVYAGGDDVLAMLPITHAIECAIKLRDVYGEAFRDLASPTNENTATASCAIIFAHYHNPLREVMKLAHKKLDDTAKEKNGRNSLALAVMLPGGVNNCWVGRFGELPKSLVKLRDKIANENCYSASFFYNLRERYGDWFDKCGEENRRAIVLAEYVKGASLKDDGKQENTEKAVDDFLTACRSQRGDGKTPEKLFQLEGAFIARFLAELNRFDPPKKE